MSYTSSSSGTVMRVYVGFGGKVMPEAYLNCCICNKELFFKCVQGKPCKAFCSKECVNIYEERNRYNRFEIMDLE